MGRITLPLAQRAPRFDRPRPQPGGTTDMRCDAADAAEEVAENVSEFANDVTRKAGKQSSRAANMATDAYEEAHEASKKYPHVTLALAGGLGFLLGVIATRR